MSLKAKHIIVSGRVQGVFFRKNTKQKATEFNVDGWVKNTYDDKVEIFAQGNEENLNKFIDWCKQGPPKATVKNIQVSEKQAENNLKGFSILYED
jgi:acylphosphatase